METRVELDDGSVGISSVPFGASAGEYEAVVLFDGDPNRFRGKGMLKAVGNVNTEIAEALVGKDAGELRAIDEALVALDGTPNKARLGGNAVLSVSLAVARALAHSQRLPVFQLLKEQYQLPERPNRLPYPMMVILEGGRHADNSTDFQEYLVVPEGAPSVHEGVRWGVEVMMALKDILKKEHLSTNVGNEGAFAPAGIASNELPLELITAAIEVAGFVPGKDIYIAMDPASSEVFDEGMYRLPKDGKALNSQEMIDLFLSWVEKYPFISLEDVLDENDWEHWPELTARLREKNVLSIGDDLTVTNVQRLQQAIDQRAISGLLVKYNQVGSLSETIDAMVLANENDIATIVSHRGGGETNGTFMIDLAVAAGARYVKVGPTRGERVGKYNRLIAIEQLLAQPGA